MKEFISIATGWTQQQIDAQDDSFLARRFLLERAIKEVERRELRNQENGRSKQTSKSNIPRRR